MTIGLIETKNLVAEGGSIGGWEINLSGISKGVTSLTSSDEYGLLTIPFIKIPKSNYYFHLIPGSGSSVVGYFQGSNDHSTTQVVGIASDEKSIVLESHSNHIRLSANKDIFLEGENLYWNNQILDPVAIFG